MNSFRLKTLHSYYQNEESIWDIGCDHGLLGLSFQSIESVKSINLVDPSKSVIDVLQRKIRDAYISIPKIFIHHKEGQKLSINSISNCIFIAGMGGNEIGSIISHLVNDLDESSQMVISPHRNILELRSLLRTLPVTLECEEVIEDHQHFYQIMRLRKTAGPKVSPFGDKLWETETGSRYRDHQITYFSQHTNELSRLYVNYLKGL